MMTLDTLSKIYLPAIEAEMQQIVAQAGGEKTDELRSMLAYHLGWEGEGAGPQARGKRIRPLLVFLSAASVGGDWQNALAAAAAVELLHNFSLIHDDIEDNSPLRRGRATLWKRWGIPQAINAGDALFSLAHLALLRLGETVSPAIALNASQILLTTSLRLTQGQYLDMFYEGRARLSIDAYWPMIGGKTAALLAACTELGALLGGANEAVCQAYRHFGYSLGLAFQAQDDYLGIWGDGALTGKSAESDLVSGKKSLPVLFGLSQKGWFAERWEKGPITIEEAPEIASRLADEGANAYTQNRVAHLTNQALQALQAAPPQGEAGQVLFELVNILLSRKA